MKGKEHIKPGIVYAPIATNAIREYYSTIEGNIETLKEILRDEDVNFEIEFDCIRLLIELTKRKIMKDHCA